MREVVQLPKASSLSATCACRSALRRAGPISRFFFFAGLEWGGLFSTPFMHNKAIVGVFAIYYTACRRREQKCVP